MVRKYDSTKDHELTFYEQTTPHLFQEEQDGSQGVGKRKRVKLCNSTKGTFETTANAKSGDSVTFFARTRPLLIMLPTLKNTLLAGLYFHIV